jgi:hypothetical protein
MKHRCESTKSPSYQYYGARGISVCPQWDTFPAFLEDIDQLLGPRPIGYSLDRIDPNGHYEPANVRWASAKEQVANRR